MISIPIQITKQELADFPLKDIQIDEKWKDLIDPQYEYMYSKKRTYRKNK